MTLAGQLRYHRVALLPSSPSDAVLLASLKQEKMVFPLDEALGIDKLPFKVSLEAMLEICYWVQEIPSYEAAEKAIRHNADIRLTYETIRSVANHVGSLVFRADKDRAERVWGILQSGNLSFPSIKKAYDFYIEIDGATLQVRRDNNDKLSEGDKKSIWLENKLGMVFSSEYFIRWIDQEGEIQHKIGPREYITYLGEAEEFKKYLFATAIRNGYGSYCQTILISDGASWTKSVKEELFPDAQQILSYYHLSEHIKEYAKSIFYFDDKIYKSWSKNVCHLFIISETANAINEINNSYKKLFSKNLENLLTYINNNIDNVDYSYYKKMGWYIGSDAIEIEKKMVLQQRLKQAGMRWSQDSGQNILTLMSKVKSGLWEKDVSEPIRARYEVEGAFKNLGYPLRRGPNLSSSSE
jgi:hypothetical protein